MICMFVGAIVIMAIVLILKDRRYKQKLFQRLGIPGPQPSLLFGNLSAIVDLGTAKTIQKWTEKYGKTFGYYEGPMPVLVTSDVDILQEIFIKKFSNFNRRKFYPMAEDPDKCDKRTHVFMANGARWRRIRSIVNPTFSMNKMKRMAPLMNQCIDVFMKILEEKCTEGKPFDIYSCYQGLTLDIIGSCAFGLDIQSQRNPEDKFRFHCTKLLEDFANPNILVILCIVIPELRKFWLLPNKLWTPRDAMTWLVNKAGEIIALRKECPIRRGDLMEYMLDAESDQSAQDLTNLTKVPMDIDYKASPGSKTSVITENRADGTSEKSTTNQTHTTKRLTTNEIKSNIAFFLLAGFETTSNALAYVAFELAQNTDVQHKLYEEFSREELIDKEEITYEDVYKLKYLDMVINEVLRMYPIGPSVTTRRALKDCVIRGVTIPKDTNVSIDVFSMHYNQDLWGPEDVNKFHPERFLPEARENRPQMAFVPFGAGPRICLGMRFAMLELKLTLTRMLRRFHVKTCAETRCPLQTQEVGTIKPAHGVTVILVRR